MSRGTFGGLAAATLTGVLCAASFAVLPAAADAAPPPSPATRVQHAMGSSRDAVLIVHTRAHDVYPAVRAAERSGAGLRHTFERGRAFSVQVPRDGEAARIAQLRRLPGVTAIEPAVARHLFAAAPTPDDPAFGNQRSYLAAVHAPAAWAQQHGSQAVRIAVLDTGVDVTHPDLAGKVVGTYNAHTGGSAVTDEIGHGTFVAGVAAAATGNGIGVAGAGYDTSLLAVKIASPDGELPIDDEIAGIRWAVAHGANVINLSLGGPDSSTAERNAVEYAIGKGVLVVAAAGNAGTTEKQYPAAYPGVVAVGATDPSRRSRADFSSRGSWVTLGAPGVGVYSTTPLAGSDDFPGRSGYGAGDGTSFAAPLVAGAAALIDAQDPGATEPQVRAALVASAGGYPRAGLGAGQVDFARALAQVPPPSRPASVSESGAGGQVNVAAGSTAPAVAFRIDSGPRSAPVPVHGGRATGSLPTWGLANGQHTLEAFDCSSAGICSAAPTSITFDLSNSAPVLTSPAAGATATGLFTVAASHDGGAARLYVDGRTAGYAASSPFRFDVDGSALSDGQHTLQIALCNPGGTQCGGPSTEQRTVTTQSLHPQITSLSPATISPNGDGVADTAQLTFRLPDRESVVVQTRDAAGRVVASDRLGVLAAGTHRWTWGSRASTTRLTDGGYTLALITSTVASTDASYQPPTTYGYAARRGVVDTTAPALHDVTGGGATVYPIRDGYRDTFRPGADLGDAGRFELVITGAHGGVVRTITARRGAGPTTLAWNGRTRHGHRLPAGTYHWHFTIVDAVGNARSSAPRRVHVSSKRLVQRTVDLIRNGASAYAKIATNPHCTSASAHHSGYPHGILLTDGCPASNGDIAFASYRFTVPNAIAYRRLTFSVLGRSEHRPSQLAAAIQRRDGGLEIPRHTKITKSGERWTRLLGASVGPHLTARHRLFLSVVLDGSYAHRNDFDIRSVRVRVGVTQLR